jgi:hypothetical protein
MTDALNIGRARAAASIHKRKLASDPLYAAAFAEARRQIAGKETEGNPGPSPQPSMPGKENGKPGACLVI